MNLSLHRKAKRATRGFTIIEIMIAMVIFGMIVAAIFATWSAVAHGSVAGNRAAATAQRSRIALRTMEDALGATRSYVADVQYYTFDAENGSEPYLSFVTKLSPSFPRSGRFGGCDAAGREGRLDVSRQPAGLIRRRRGICARRG